MKQAAETGFSVGTAATRWQRRWRAYEAPPLGFLGDRARLVFVGGERLLAEDVLAWGPHDPAAVTVGAP